MYFRELRRSRSHLYINTAYRVLKNDSYSAIDVSLVIIHHLSHRSSPLPTTQSGCRRATSLHIVCCCGVLVAATPLGTRYSGFIVNQTAEIADCTIESYESGRTQSPVRRWVWCNKYSPSGGVFIVVKYRLPKSAASGERAGTGLQPWLAADAFLRRSRACPGRQCVQRSAPARDSSSCSLSGAGVWDQRCAAGTR